jgi:tight adherence protein B
MLSVWVLFGIVLIASFAAVMLMTRPTVEEKRVEQRLTDITSGRGEGGEEPVDLLQRVTYSDVPLLDAVFRGLAFTRRLKAMITQADSSWTVGRLVATTLLIFAVAEWLASILIPSVILGLVLAVGLSLLPYVSVLFQRQMRFRKFEETLPDAIDLMSRALRAGHSVSAAIEMVSQEVANPTGAEFRKTFEQQNFGLPFREALEDLARRIPLPDLQFLVTAILVQKETGGNLAEILDKTASVIRERARLKGQLRIYTAQGRLTSWILGLLPFIMFVLLSLVNPNYTRILIEDPVGQRMVIVGLVLMGLGFYVIRRIVNIKV